MSSLDKPSSGFQLKPEASAYSTLPIIATNTCVCGKPIAKMDDDGLPEWRHENGRAQCGSGRGWASPKYK